MKLIFGLFFLMALSGCGAIERATTKFTGNLTYKCSKHGVEYVQSDSGLAVSVGTNGQPVPCN